VVYRGAGDEKVLDTAIDIALENRRQMILVVPVIQLSPISHSTPILLEETCLELEAEAGDKARAALDRIPDSIRVATRLVRPRGEAAVLAGSAGQVELVVCAEEATGSVAALFSRSRGVWFRKARSAGIAALKVPCEAAGAVAHPAA
jgi:hypothetical protein